MEQVHGGHHQGAGRCLELLVAHLHPDRAAKNERHLVLAMMQVRRDHPTRLQPDPHGRRPAGEPLVGDLDSQPHATELEEPSTVRLDEIVTGHITKGAPCRGMNQGGRAHSPLRSPPPKTLPGLPPTSAATASRSAPASLRAPAPLGSTPSAHAADRGFSERGCKSIRSARETMMPSGRRTEATRQACSYSPMPPTRPYPSAASRSTIGY